MSPLTVAEVDQRAKSLVNRNDVYTIVGDGGAVTVTSTCVCGITTYEIQHPSFVVPHNPKGIFVSNSLEVVGKYARKIARHGSALA